MNVRLRHFTEFTAGVYYDGVTLMNNYRLNLYFVTTTIDVNEHNIALNRIKYFIQNLDSTVFIKKDYEDQCQRLVEAGFKITTLPEEPVDQVVGIMLYLKLNAIMEERMAITQTEISSDLGDQIVYLHDDEESFGLFESIGWWNNPDPSHCDNIVVGSDKTVAINKTASWKELNLGWNEYDLSKVDDNKVVFADFQRDDTK